MNFKSKNSREKGEKKNPNWLVKKKKEKETKTSTGYFKSFRDWGLGAAK